VTTRSNQSEGRRSQLASLLAWVYHYLKSETIRRRLRWFIVVLEGGPELSLTIRSILRRQYGVDVGLHSVSPCVAKPQVLHRGTTVGRYSRIAETVRTFTRHHPMNTKSSHGLFYNPALGWANAAPLAFGTLAIGHGVSIGHNAIILHPAKRVGDGAVIAPGAVVYFDVPDYALVEGNPAVVVGFRHAKDEIERILASRWWEEPPSRS
jgi:acetyltransferase-like isoleucine patch superfamily enzyme